MTTSFIYVEVPNMLGGPGIDFLPQTSAITSSTSAFTVHLHSRSIIQYLHSRSIDHSLTHSLTQSINTYLSLIICTRPDSITCTHTKALARPGAQKIEQKPRCCRHRKGRAHQVQKSAQTRGREPQVRMAQASRRPEAMGRAQHNGDGGKE